MHPASTQKIWYHGYIPGLYLLLFMCWLAWMLTQVLLYLLQGRDVNTVFPLGRRWWGALIEAVVFFLLLLILPFLFYGCGNRERVAWNDTATYEYMFASWQEEHSDCPTSVEELARSINKKGRSTKDPWGNEYLIVCPSQHDLDIDICSNGADEQPNTSDDICNWKPQPR
jgi:hypothetical protein